MTPPTVFRDLGPTGAGPAYYLVSIPSLPLININNVKGGHFRIKGPKVAALREAACAAAEGLPRMDRARVICFVTLPRMERRPGSMRWDPANWYPSAKACVDGFTDAHLWADDDVRHVIGPDMRGVTDRKEPPHGRLVFKIVDLSEGGTGDADARIV